jgi:hypothetical protein
MSGPPGFCVDETATRAEGDTAFVLIGNCAAISNPAARRSPMVPVVLTAAISEASDGGSISESLGDLDTYFRSEEGLALLSRTQDAESRQRDRNLVEADQFLIHASDTSTGAMEGVAQDYWRAYFDMGSRIATFRSLRWRVKPSRGRTASNALRAFVAVDAAGQCGGHLLQECRPRRTKRVPPRGGLFNVGLFRRVFE